MWLQGCSGRSCREQRAASGQGDLAEEPCRAPWAGARTLSCDAAMQRRRQPSWGSRRRSPERKKVPQNAAADRRLHGGSDSQPAESSVTTACHELGSRTGAPRTIGVRRGGTCPCTTSLQQAPKLWGVE